MQIENHTNNKIRELITELEEAKKDMQEQADSVDYEDHFAEGYIHLIDDLIPRLTKIIK